MFSYDWIHSTDRIHCRIRGVPKPAEAEASAEAFSAEAEAFILYWLYYY